MNVNNAAVTIMPLLILNSEKMYANSLTTLLLVGAQITFERDGRVVRVERVEAAEEGKLRVQASGCQCSAFAEEISVATPLSIAFECHEARVPEAVQLSLSDAYPGIFPQVQCIQVSPER